jgi:hypothetical protein
MLSASQFILPARPFRAALCAARTEFRSSYFKNTPPNFHVLGVIENKIILTIKKPVSVKDVGFSKLKKIGIIKP